MKRFKFTRIIGAAILIAAFAPQAFAGPFESANPSLDLVFPEQQSERREFFDGVLEFGVLGQNIFLWQSDSDFNSEKAYYQPEGQTVGYLATFLNPEIAFVMTDSLRLVYEFEIGLNIWSRNNPEASRSGDREYFTYLHRQLYTEYGLLGSGVRVGYQHLSDPTGLMINHWVGAANVFVNADPVAVGLVFSQIPDQTNEGFDINENNFTHDVFSVAAAVRYKSDYGLSIVPGAVYMHDASTIEYKKWLVAPELSLAYDSEDVTFALDFIYQVGEAEHAAFNLARKGDEEDIRAWAAQLSVGYDPGEFGLQFNAFALSPDDPYEANGVNGAFYYSGKNRSRTIILTENELRDVGGNIDERLGTDEGSFYQLRPGIAVADLSIEYELLNGFITPALILGYGSTLEAKNSNGENSVGFEADLDLKIAGDYITFDLIGGVLVPGAAASAFINKLDREKTDPIYMFGLVLSAQFGG